MACPLGPGKCRFCRLEEEGKFCTRCNAQLWSDRTCPRCRVYIAPYLTQNQAPLVGPEIAGEKRVAAKQLTITDEKVRAMAAKCPDAARVLKEGFPEAFPREDGAQELYSGSYIYDKPGGQVIAELRNAGNFKGAALIAKYGYTAQVVTDDQGIKVVAFFKKRV